VTFLPCDVRVRESVQRAFGAAAAQLGGLDVLVIAAGARWFCPADDITDDHWDATISTNLTGTYLTNQAAFPHLREAGGGRIINFSSSAALGPLPNGAAYASAKAGVIGWTHTVAHE
jgi:NAD(P)-dependent dehydrogenase (short-subunit alcohol dehydrogenase family)